MVSMNSSYKPNPTKPIASNLALVTIAQLLARQAALEASQSEFNTTNSKTTINEDLENDQRQTGSATHTERSG
jgi:hypothetical protein